MIFYFTRPFYLIFLFIIPILVILHFVSLKIRRNNAVKFSNFSAVARIRNIDLYSKGIFSLIVHVLLVTTMVLSLAGMHVQREVPVTGYSFVLAIDSSKSMEADDILPNRLEAAKRVSTEFIDSISTGTRVGVASFSGSTFIEQEVTSEKELVKEGIRFIEITSVGGTDIYEAIVTSVNMLKSEESRAVILISDGQINVGDLNKALDYAREQDTIIHTIGMGTEEGGTTSFGLSKLDEEALESMAYTTGGQYFKVTSRGELSDSFSKLFDYKIGRLSIDATFYLLFASVVLLIINYLISSFKYRMP